MGERFASLAQEFKMTARFAEAARPIPTVIMVSQHGHCLHDLLFRWRSGVLPIERARASCPTTATSTSSRPATTFRSTISRSRPRPRRRPRPSCSRLFEAEGGELLVLARYMQVLSDDLCRKLSGRAINIHHSFLPSFKGARPYQQAHDRGVKLIGATAHYVTGDLDEGPIIEQDVARANHGMDVATLTTLGRDTESAVLARAVKWHAEHRILLDGHKTVVFR